MTDFVTEELGEFFDYFWHDTPGFVYLPVHEFDGSDRGRWVTYMFQWPRQRAGVVRHVLKWAANPNCEPFFSPAIFSIANPERENVKGSWTLWVDFDGNAPEHWLENLKSKSVPVPTLIVQSSIPGHEHCYWQLDTFLDDFRVLEDRNRALAYTMSADTSGWDADQILRPIHTTNRKRGKPVTVKEWDR